MIFCMVGMHDAGFERLVRAVDEYAGRNPEREVVIQIGSCAFKPKHASYFGFKPSLEAYIQKAEIIVSHGSICILEALKMGKRVIAVPRLARHGEHMNDHQVRSMQHFQKKFEFQVVMDVSRMEEEITKAEKQPSLSPFEFQATGLHRDLGRYLEQLDKETGNRL